MTPMSPMEAMYSIFSCRARDAVLPCHDPTLTLWETSEIYPIKDPELNSRITRIFIKEIFESQEDVHL